MQFLYYVFELISDLKCDVGEILKEKMVTKCQGNLRHNEMPGRVVLSPWYVCAGTFSSEAG